MLLFAAILIISHLDVIRDIFATKRFNLLLNYPLIGLVLIDFLMAVSAYLGSRGLHPLLRGRAMLTLGLGAYVGWALDDSPVLIASVAAGLGAFGTTLSSRFFISILTVALGIAGSGFLAYLAWNGYLSGLLDSCYPRGLFRKNLLEEIGRLLDKILEKPMQKKRQTQSPSKADWKARLHKKVKRTETLINKDIWELKYLGGKTPQARLYQLMRVLVLTVQGLQRNNLQVQSAALTFYSLIGIGPLIALGIMISGFVLDQSAESSTDAGGNRAVEVITQAIAYAAPQLELSIDDDDIGLAPEVLEMVNSFIDAAQSGTVGVIGSLMLFAIGIQVLSSIERSFNSLWGVDKGRKLVERIVVYWTFISMGAVIGATALNAHYYAKTRAIHGATTLWRYDVFHHHLH